MKVVISVVSQFHDGETEDTMLYAQNPLNRIEF